MKRTTMTARAIGLAWLAGTVGMLAASGTTSETMSSPMAMDVRNDCRKLIATGTVSVSDRDEVQSTTVLFGVDGRAITGWSGVNPEWDSTTVDNGQHDIYLKAATTYSYSSFLVLNDDVVVHGGALEANEVWEADKVHVLAHWVRIPEGMTLSIENGAVVKFSDTTGIKVDGTLQADNAVFTTLADDTVGGDTDDTVPTGTFVYDTYAITGEGTKDVNECDVRFLSTLPFNVTWKKDSVYPICGTVTVPAGVRLTVEEGAILKFDENSSLLCQEGGEVVTVGAVITHIHDDTIGGDTDRDEGKNKPVYGDFAIEGFLPDVTSDLHYYMEVMPETTIANGETVVFKSGAVIHVTGDIIVENGGKLDIMAGAIVKLADGASITVKKGGTLLSTGIEDKDVYVTSVHDDTIGGDTDEDEGATKPAAGDWNVISVNGNAEICRTVLSYGGATTGALFCGLGSSVAVNVSRIEHSAVECIHVTGGAVMIDNTVFKDADSFGSCSATDALKVRNCIVTEVENGNGGSKTVFVNTVFYKVETFAAKGYETTGYSYCLFYNPEGEGEQSSKAVGKNGNIWGDPKFKDAENGDYSIGADSPCVDAGDGVNGVEKDCDGKIRMDVRSVKDTGVANAAGVCPDMGIYEVEGRELFRRSYSLVGGWNILALPQPVASDKDENKTLWDELAPMSLNASGKGYNNAAFPGEDGMVVWIYSQAPRNVTFLFGSDETPETGICEKNAMYRWVLLGVKGTEDVEVSEEDFGSIWTWNGSRWQFVPSKDGKMSLAHETGYFATRK